MKHSSSTFVCLLALAVIAYAITGGGLRVPAALDSYAAAIRLAYVPPVFLIVLMLTAVWRAIR